MNGQIFGVKLIFKYVVNSKMPQVLYEEQILRIKAESFDNAYQKADEYVASYINKYTNINGDTVEISLHKEVDCFLAYDEKYEIQEVYSGIYNLDSNALNAMSTPCDKDEMYILKHW